ncbi:MAG: hypothetical protein LBC75_10285 [Fibromonadaceae bacterium]|jgi:hypothetical protein|nr:hypothetical protein [Fibromonadaceae bacterium]
MNRTNLLLSAFILSAMFLLGCSSECEKCDECSVVNPSSSSVKPSSSSGGNSSSSGGGTIEDQKLVRKNITLSSEKSYVDIDGEPIAYAKENAANNLSKIDLVAYCSTDMGCKNNSIYSPYEINLFWNPAYIGSNIYLFKIPPEQSDIFKTATRLYEIIPAYNNLISSGVLSGTGVDEISIEEGRVFFISTSENNTGFVIIKASQQQAVDLEIVEMPK